MLTEQFPILGRGATNEKEAKGSHKMRGQEKTAGGSHEDTYILHSRRNCWFKGEDEACYMTAIGKTSRQQRNMSTVKLTEENKIKILPEMVSGSYQTGERMSLVTI